MAEGLQNPWVKLHLEHQSESTYMPSFIIGRLHQETAGSYVLTDVIEQGEDYEPKAVPGMSFINRTYVWRCQILEEDPTFELVQQHQDYESGGLG